MPTKAQVVKRIEDAIETAREEKQRLADLIVKCKSDIQTLTDRVELLSEMLTEDNGEPEDEAPDFNKVATE